jgi:NAD(P)-dependent dehydrogenase (short-subunit alcohol dehydrogenase family)
MSTWSLNEKVFLITGGARGIGAATAAELARRGARPVLADLDGEALDRVRATISPAPLTIEVDVTDAAACVAAVERAVDAHGKLDAVWANAGIAAFGPLLAMDPRAWTRTVEVNLLGAYNTVRAALPAVIDQRGYVAVTASMASFAHTPGFSAYSATKAGVEAMSNALRVEVAHLGVQVCTIHPTWIGTDMVREAEGSLRAYTRLRQAMRPPFKRTLPVEQAVSDIVSGFERRQRRICSPRYMQVAHLLRPALTTRLFERDWRAAAPDINRLFAEDIQSRGAEGAAVSERIARQLAQPRARTEA